MMAAPNIADSDDSYNLGDEEQDEHEAQELEKTSGGPGQDDPDASHKNASYTTDSDRLSCTEQGRGRLRDLDRHASWREVYAANHVGVGHE